MTKKEKGREPKEVAPVGVLTRRSAIKRIAAGLAGAGVVVVAGMISPVRATHRSDIIKAEYGDTVKDQYGDSAPKNR